MRNSILKKYRIILVSLILIVSVVIGGCAQGGSPQTSTTAGQEPEKVTIRVLSRFSGTDATTPVWQEAIAEFMARNEHITVVDESVNEEAAYNNKLRTGIATGNMPNIAYMAGVLTLIDYAKNGVIMDVTPLMEDKEWFDGFIGGTFETWNLEPYGVKGYYGVPYSVAPEVILYNKDLFAQAGIDKVPETMDELYDAIDKLNAIDVVPWAVGGKSTWRVGHIHNYLLYKWAGVDKAIQLGTREAKWTDPEVVQSMQFLKDLKERGAFIENFEGMDYDMEKVQFFNEEAAMMLNGSWFVGDVIGSDIHDKIDVFAFPYFSEKPEFKYHGVNFPQGFQLKGKMEGAEKQATIDFIKFWTSKETQEKMVRDIQRMPSRKDLDLEGVELSHVFIGYNEIMKNMEVLGGDSFDYDPLASMQDRTRNSLVGMLLGKSAEAAAQEIQAEIDSNQD